MPPAQDSLFAALKSARIRSIAAVKKSKISGQRAIQFFYKIVWRQAFGHTTQPTHNGLRVCVVYGLYPCCSHDVPALQIITSGFYQLLLIQIKLCEQATAVHVQRIEAKTPQRHGFCGRGGVAAESLVAGCKNFFCNLQCTQIIFLILIMRQTGIILASLTLTLFICFFAMINFIGSGNALRIALASVGTFIFAVMTLLEFLQWKKN